jgi:hypothetical protein
MVLFLESYLGFRGDIAGHRNLVKQRWFVLIQGLKGCHLNGCMIREVVSPFGTLLWFSECHTPEVLLKALMDMLGLSI